jgi:Domain of unknown function (DUF4082)
MNTPKILTKLSLVAASATMLSLAIVGKAQAAAIDFTNPSGDLFHNGGILGFQFTTNDNINVTELGFYDDLQNDLTESHDVGIFDSSGNLLVSGTVKPGDTLDGWFRYTSVTPTLLAANQTFRIATVTGNEFFTDNPEGFTVAPEINFVRDVFTFSSTLTYPNNTTYSMGYFGPNFKFEASNPTSVPEPTSVLGLLTVGGLALGTFSRKQKA